MRKSLLRRSIPLAGLLLTAAEPNGSDLPPNNEIVVTGQRLAIVVNGKAVRCRPLASDPQNAALQASSRTQLARQSILIPAASGDGFRLVDDSEQIGGRGVWRRVGRDINQYVFRAPDDGHLLCIGAKGSYPAGYGQLRQILDARAYIGKRLRFTAWAASRDAGRVNFWLASADPNAEWGTHKPYECGPLVHNLGDPLRGCIFDGGNSNGHDWRGSHGWTPVLIEIGPVSKLATVISFGFVISGSGDVWIYQPKVEVISANDPYQRKGEVFVIGSDRTSSSKGNAPLTRR